MFKALTVAFLIMAIALVVLAFGDEAPIAGTVKAIDASANTLTLQTTAKGKTRDVTGGVLRRIGHQSERRDREEQSLRT